MCLQELCICKQNLLFKPYICCFRKRLNMSCDYSLSSSWKGKSWKDWIAKLNVENISKFGDFALEFGLQSCILVKEKDKRQHHKKYSESVRTLPRKDILLHGQYRKEEFSELCSCERCGKVIMMQSFLSHVHTRHGPGHHQQQDTSKNSLDVKKKSKNSKSKKKIPQITGHSVSTTMSLQTLRYTL